MQIKFPQLNFPGTWQMLMHEKTCMILSLQADAS